MKNSEYVTIHSVNLCILLLVMVPFKKKMEKTSSEKNI